MSYTFDGNIISDLHKDARGFRPSVAWMHAWKTSNEEEKQGIWDSLCNELESEIEYEKKMQEKALSELQERIQETISLGAGDEITAIKWILEGEKFSDIDYCYGADYCAFHFGLSYQNPLKEKFDMVCKEKAKWSHLEDA